MLENDAGEEYGGGGIDGIYPFSVTTKNGNLPLPFFGGNYPIVLLDNIY